LGWGYETGYYKLLQLRAGLTLYSTVHITHIVFKRRDTYLEKLSLPGRSAQVPGMHRPADRGRDLAALVQGRAYQIHAMMWMLSQAR